MRTRRCAPLRGRRDAPRAGRAARRWPGAALASLLPLLLGACAAIGGAASAPGGRSGEPPAAARERAERSLYSGLTEGIRRYHLAPGDVLELLYTGAPEAQSETYTIGVRDKLQIDFFYHPETSRAAVVRPDGRITLPLKGDLMAAGLTAQELALRIQDAYADIYREPVVTVSVEEFSSPFSELGEALKTSQSGRTKEVMIAPDGLAFLPLLPPVEAGGRTVREVAEEVNRLYAERLGDVQVSVSLKKVVGDRVFVFGEVRNPGVRSVSRPETALQAITAAGGALTSGSMGSVKVLAWSPEGEPQVHTLDLAAVLDGRELDQDMVLPPNAVVYVPPTTIAKLDRFVDQYIKQLFLYNGVGVGFSFIYELNRQNGTTTVPQ